MIKHGLPFIHQQAATGHGAWLTRDFPTENLDAERRTGGKEYT